MTNVHTSSNNISVANRQRALADLVNRHVYVCQTELVERFMFNIGDIVNLYYTETELKENGDSSVEEAIKHGEHVKTIYEWWTVSSWLERHLEQQHEPILRNDYGVWWGRTCTGQAIYLDSVIEQIYKDTQL